MTNKEARKPENLGKETLGLAAPIIQSRFDIDWNAIHISSNPTYITQLSDQHNLYLNQAAVLAQSGKPPAEFLSSTAHALNYEDELVTRCGHIKTDSFLTEYSYEAMRWFQDESGLWVRRRMSFVSNFWRVEYLGQDCWLGEVLQAEALNQFISS